MGENSKSIESPNATFDELNSIVYLASIFVTSGYTSIESGEFLRTGLEPVISTDF